MALSDHHKSWNRFRWVFFAFALIHIILVFLKSHIIGYQLSYDAVKYLHVANEFLGRATLDYQYNCNTSPGYPLFLASIIMIFPDSVTAIATVQVLIFTGSLYFLMSTLVRRKYFTSTQALIACAFIMLALDFITYNGYVLTESLTASLLMMITGLLLQDRHKNINLFILSAVPVVLIAVRTEYIVLFPAFLLAVYLNGRNWKRIALPVSLLVVLCVGNGLRNQKIYDRFSFFGFGGSQVTYGGNNMNGDGSWHYYKTTPGYLPDHAVKEMSKIDLLDECLACPGRDSLFKVLVKEAVVQNGFSHFQTVPLKLAKMWTLPGEIDPYTSDTTFSKSVIPDNYFRSSESIISNIISNKYIVYYWLTLGISLIGLMVCMISRKLHYFDKLALVVLITVSLAYSVLFYGLPRFHIPLLPFILIYSAFSFSILMKSLRIKSAV